MPSRAAVSSSVSLSFRPVVLHEHRPRLHEVERNLHDAEMMPRAARRPREGDHLRERLNSGSPAAEANVFEETP